jgi:hypothetical protein
MKTSLGYSITRYRLSSIWRVAPPSGSERCPRIRCNRSDHNHPVSNSTITANAFGISTAGTGTVRIGEHR